MVEMVTTQAAALYCMVNTHRCLKFSEAYTPKSELTTYIMSKEIPQRYEVNISGGSGKGSVRQLDTRFGDYGEVDVQDNKNKSDPNIGALKPDLSVTATPGLPPQSSPVLTPPYSPSSSTSSQAAPDTTNTMRFSYSKLLFPDEEEDEAPPTDAPDLVSASHPNEDTVSESPSPTSPEVPCVFPKCPPRRQGSAKQKGKSSKSSLPVIPEVSTQVPAIPPNGILPSNISDSGADQDQSSDGTTSVSPKIPPQVPPRHPKGVVTADQSDNSSASASPEVPPIPPRPSKVSDTNSIKAVADSRSLKRQNSRSLPVVDHFKIPYKDLDFSKMDSLAQLTLQRELEQVIEKERRKQARVVSGTQTFSSRKRSGP